MKHTGSNCGIIYVATGAKYLAEAVHSIRSVKQVSPTIPVAVVSDAAFPCNLVDIHLHLSNPRYSFIDKILALRQTPFEKTLFLDTDTFALEPLDEVFQLLDRFDFAAAAEPARYLYRINGVPSAFPELNSGVILYKKNEVVLQTIQRWHDLYEDEIAEKISTGIRPWHDQLSFTRAIYGSDLSFFLMPPEFNARILMPQAVSGHIRIAHCRLKQPDHYDATLSRLNKIVGPRIINPNPRRIPEIVRRTLFLFRILER
jgi:hypothetical protein